MCLACDTAAERVETTAKELIEQEYVQTVETRQRITTETTRKQWTEYEGLSPRTSSPAQSYWVGRNQPYDSNPTAACTATIGWRRGVVVSGVRRVNEVNARRARLVPGWVTVFGRVYHLGI